MFGPLLLSIKAITQVLSQHCHPPEPLLPFKESLTTTVPLLSIHPPIRLLRIIRMSRNTLRPCLKHNTDLDPPAPTNSPLPFALCSSVRVHFPPPPVLCQTHLTHSAATYDRAPIVVLPNACALPERNGRTYTESCNAARKRRSTQAAAQGATLHPQALAASAAPSSAQTSVSDPAGRMPSLVPDFSSCSESDESDISSTPPISTHFPPSGLHYPHHHHHHHQYAPISIVVDGNADPAAALAFLPHANEREKPRSRSKTRGTRTSRKSEFALPELDGCLGGF